MSFVSLGMSFLNEAHSQILQHVIGVSHVSLHPLSKIQKHLYLIGVCKDLCLGSKALLAGTSASTVALLRLQWICRISPFLLLWVRHIQ